MADLKIFTTNIEEKALEQINTLASQKAFDNSKIRIMPDVHAGTGCVIGFTADLGDKVIPNVVGVDIGCLDKETEILTPNGWIKISNYNNQKILVYNKDTNKAFYEYPRIYIKQPCTEFYYYKNKKGLDQMVSQEHRMLVFKGYKSRGYKINVLLPSELNEHSLSNGYYNFKTSFEIENEGINLTENQIKILAMVQADGTLRKNNNIELHFSKKRKVERAKKLLKKENLDFKEYQGKDATTFIIFKSKLFYSKDLSIFYKATKEQLKILAEEALFWDGHIGYRSFYSSTNKINVDVIQFAYASIDIRASIHKHTYSTHKSWKPAYTVTITRNNMVNYNTKGVKIACDNEYKYCFNTSTGFFIARRNNNIFITGNCGVLCTYLGNIDIDLKELDNFIKKEIPLGKNVHINSQYSSVIEEDILKKLYCYNELREINYLTRSLGTLGGNLKICHP